MTHGTQEARRAFNEDQRWKHGATYVFVDAIKKAGQEVIAHVYPPDPSREGAVLGIAIDSFGNDLNDEVYRMMSIVDSGWLYYAFPNPATGREEPKSSYVVEIDWNGERAVIGSGLYAPDLPGTCNANEVNAAALEAHPSDERLQEFVRCAAMIVQSKGYFAREELENGPRWNYGSTYPFVMDMMGNQVLTGNKTRVNGIALHEWGGRTAPADQFGGRDMASVGDTFGEALIYYRSLNPMTGGTQAKVGFVKRVVAQGVPVLVGAGYYVSPDRTPAAESCADHYVEASAIRSRRGLKAFVQCATEYLMEHGLEEARRAFTSEKRWREGPHYLGVHAITPSAGETIVRIFPPQPSREGNEWGEPLIDRFGTDFFLESHRLMSLVDSAWIHYSFTNFVSGREEPKSSYVNSIDWNGERLMIGAGIYQRDVPGACASGAVNAATIESSPTPTNLQEFVRCAAMNVESMGFFAGQGLSRDPRWNSGPIYVFGINVVTGEIEFSGSESSFRVSGRIPELLFEGRDMVNVTATFGEAFWYYEFANRATGAVEPKLAFTKLVLAHGVPLLVGSGYSLEQTASLN